MSMLSRAEFPHWVHRHRRALGLLAIVVPPLLPLLLHRDLYADWYTHAWRSRYYAAYFLEHLSFPFTVDSLDAIGQADPLFYGRFYYPLMGVLTAAVGYALAIRLGIAACLLLIAWTVLRFAERREREPVAWVIAASAVWETYALTNLYFRYALTEVFAQAALRGALLLLMGFLDSGRRPVRERATLLAGGFFCWNAAIEMHPVTGLYGTVLLILCLAGYALLFHARDLPRTIAWVTPPALASVALHLPFVAAYRALGGELGMQQTLRGLGYLPGIDNPLVRLSPVPLDIRIFTEPLEDIVGPFLSAQFNWSLAIALGLAAASAWRRGGHRARLASVVAGVAGTAGFLFAVSIAPPLAEAFSPAFNFPQFAYRFVGFVNVLLLFGVLLVLRMAGTPESSGASGAVRVGGGWRVVLGLAATVLAMQAGVITLAPIVHPPKPSHAVQARDLSRQPDAQGGAWTYATPARFTAAPAEDGREVRDLNFAPQPGPHAHYRADVTCGGPCIVRTNVSAFAWNRLSCGADEPVPFVYTAPHGPRNYPRSLLGCLMPSGGTITYELRLPPLLRWSSPATIWLFLVWGAIWLALSLATWRRSSHTVARM